jgi:PBSX family phage terminase large subunit
VDEASTVPESFWTMLLSRLSLEGARLLATTNPDSPMHWLKRKYLDRAAELGLARFQFRLADNPYLPTSFVEAISREYTGLWRKRLIDGEWCVAEGAVYEMWDPARHVVAPDRLPPIVRLLAASVDYGTTAPTAGLLLGISGEQRARLVVVDEWAPPSLTDAGLSVDYRKWVGSRQPERVIIDPSAASFHKQLWADGVPGVVLAENAVIDGIRTVASLLSVDRLVVSSACKHLLTELPSYAWDPKATAKGQDAPIKQNDHFCDALRYGVATTQSRWRSLVPLTMPIEIEEAAA